MGNVALDFKIAIRVLRRRSGFAATIILTLALAIGANAAVFSVIDAVILRPLQIPDADHVVAIFRTTKTAAYEPVSMATFQALQKGNSTFQQVAAMTSTSVTLERDGSAMELVGQFVTGHYFSILGTTPEAGRFFGVADAQGNSTNSVVVLSHAFWKSRFGGDVTIVGKLLKISGQQLTVVGVAPQEFRGTNLSDMPDLWLPAPLMQELQLGQYSILKVGNPNSEINLFSMIGRLKSQTLASAAQTDLENIERARAETANTTPGNVVRRILSVVPVNEAAASIRDRATLIAYLRLLSAVVGVTLLLACLNIANLLVVRGRERSVELGVRAALGATSSMLARQLLIETLVLAAAGGAIGILTAQWALRLFSAFALPGGIVIGNLRATLDLRVLLFAGVLTLLSALIFGLYPAISGSTRSVLDRLRASDVTGKPRLIGRGALLAIQVGITLTLLTGAASFIRSLQAGLSTNLGFDSERIAAVSIRPKFDGSRQSNANLYAAVVSRMQQIPGVQSVAATSHVPLETYRTLPFHLGGVRLQTPTDADAVMMPMTSITPDFFKVLGVPIIEGRGFQVSDVGDSQHIVVVNESAARRLWPRESAIGKQFTFVNDISYTVVGVVKDTKYATLQDQGVGFIYAPMSQEDPRARMTFLARISRPRLALPLMERAVAEVAPELTTVRPRVVSDQIDAVLLPQRFGATLLSFFAALALALSAVGIHGTVAYSVSRRSRELGIRMALGGSRLHVMGTVMRDVSIAVGCGILAGTLLSGGAQQLIAHLLQNTAAPRMVTYAFATILLLAIAILAAVIPARRAANIDPMMSIRPS